MSPIRTAVATAAILVAAAGPAFAASDAQLKANALSLTQAKCSQVAGSGCHNAQVRDNGRAYYDPAAGFGPGSKQYAVRFQGWAGWLNPNVWYSCTAYVRNLSSASGHVDC